MRYSTLLTLLPFFFHLAFTTPVDPNAPVGSKENPAKILYKPSQPYQNEVINSHPEYQQPFQKTYSQSAAQNRKDTYAVYGDAPKGWSKEDQLPASAEHYGKPGHLYAVPPKEQGQQAGEISAASKKAGKPDGDKSGWMEQVTPEMRGQKSDPEKYGPAPIIPKKTPTKTPTSKPGKPNTGLGPGIGVTKPVGRKPPIQGTGKNPLILKEKQKPGKPQPAPARTPSTRPGVKSAPTPAPKAPPKPASKAPTPQRKKGGKRDLVAREAIAEAMAEAYTYADAYAEAYNNVIADMDGLSKRDAETYPYSFTDAFAVPELEGLRIREIMPSYVY